MILPVDVLEVDVLVVDVLELDVLGARQGIGVKSGVRISTFSKWVRVSAVSFVSIFFPHYS
jgi:hypothetical protein